MGGSASKPAIERAEEFATAGKKLPPFLSEEDIFCHKAYKPYDPYSYREPFDHPITTRRPLPELPIDIWQKIFVHLRREVGPISGDMIKPGHFHQDDLVNAMRVCRKFYYLAAPILYARVVTGKPHLLFYGAAKNEYGMPEKYKRWSKLDLLQFVHRLDLMYIDLTPHELDLRFPISWGDRSKLERIILRFVRDHNEINRMIRDMDNCQSAVRYVDRVRTLREQWLQSREPIIMSNLTILTISHPSFRTRYTDIPPHPRRKFDSDKHWPRYTLFPPKLSRYSKRIDGKSNRIAMISHIEKRLQFAYELARIAAPKHVCMDDTAGPFSYRRDQGSYDKVKTKPPETVTLHIFPNSVDKYILPPDKPTTMFRYRVHPYMFYGSTSRWVLNPYEWKYNSSKHQRAELFQWLKWYIGEFKRYLDPNTPDTGIARSAQDDKTKLEIYGCLDINFIDDGFQELGIQGFSNYDLLWTDQQKLAQVYDFLDMIPGVGNITLMDGQADPCPACGEEASTLY